MRIMNEEGMSRIMFSACLVLGVTLGVAMSGMAAWHGVARWSVRSAAILVVLSCTFFASLLCAATTVTGWPTGVWRWVFVLGSGVVIGSVGAAFIILGTSPDDEERT